MICHPKQGCPPSTPNVHCQYPYCDHGDYTKQQRAQLNTPSRGYNSCIDQAIKALRYLAENDRPRHGQQNFNAEHLHQIADELMKTQTILKQLGGIEK